MINFFEKIHVTDAEIHQYLADDPFKDLCDRTVDPMNVGIVFKNSPRRIPAHLRICDTCNTRALLIQWMLPEVIIRIASEELSTT